ncbi:hypothetical protein [Cohnella terricola]|uniref:DUF559 domain-containing protein n=1 Tax=Cohnella terricola TaxID=1289167 RepID=A0A559JFW8_9BACL|nr:hypothetical protein [Cohnella terricola]TVX98779.1 hypothetical protein FPZ45_15920 [Cohnella terricola]
MSASLGGIGNFDDLHPEYEIMDWRGRPYYADFAWRTPWRFVLLFEIKGFSKHVRDMDRAGYDNETNREVFLQGIGYRVISFSYDTIANKPDIGIMLLKLFISQFHPSETPAGIPNPIDKEIIRLAFALAGSIRPIDVSRSLRINYRTAKKALDNLTSNGWIRPLPKGQGERGVLYRLTDGAYKYLV